MEEKRITIDNFQNQTMAFGIEEYDEHIEIGRFLSNDIGQVEIPERIHGKPVTVIGDDCFFGCNNIKLIKLPNSITLIGAQAFAMCKNLNEIIMPDSVTEIGHHAFRDCSRLKKVVLSQKIKQLPTGLFSFCYLEDPMIILPDGLEVIESGAFWNAGEFNLLIPDSVKEIGVGAFNGGPHPITKLSEDKGWFLEWPYGETVECSAGKGKITDIYYLENNCRVHEVNIDGKPVEYFFPCDYIDEKIVFIKAENRHKFDEEFLSGWRTKNDLADAFKIRSAWERGLLKTK